MSLGDELPSWTPRAFPDAAGASAYCTAHSVTQQLLIEPLCAVRHSDGLWAALTSSGVDAYRRLFDYLPRQPPEDKPAFQDLVAGLCNKQDPMFFAVLRRNADSSGEKNRSAVVGMYSLMRTDSASGVTEIGFVLFSPLLQRTTLASELLYVVMKYVFHELRYRRFEWKCNSLNLPSMQAARRFGFTYEGTFRQALVVKGRNRDTAWWSVLDSEFLSVVGPALRTWLRDDNFDPLSGKQRRTLEDVRRDVAIQAALRPVNSKM
jgi:RimJ/RimL family protein N-acetyltransferase